MKKFAQGSVLFAALCLCAVCASNSPRAGTPARLRQTHEESGPVAPEELERARALFNERCARCHGEDGRGHTAKGEMLDAPDFTDEAWWKEGKSDRRLVHSVTEGRDGMPAFGKKLSARQIASLVAYVRRFNEAR